jgi:hypothetical protein
MMCAQSEFWIDFKGEYGVVWVIAQHFPHKWDGWNDGVCIVLWRYHDPRVGGGHGVDTYIRMQCDMVRSEFIVIVEAVAFRNEVPCILQYVAYDCFL